MNMRTYCAIHLKPRSTWDTGRCKHYDNAELLATAGQALPPTAAERARSARLARATANKCEPHHNGVLDPGKMAGRLRRVR